MEAAGQQQQLLAERRCLEVCQLRHSAETPARPFLVRSAGHLQLLLSAACWRRTKVAAKPLFLSNHHHHDEELLRRRQDRFWPRRGMPQAGAANADEWPGQRCQQVAHILALSQGERCITQQVAARRKGEQLFR